MVHSQHNSLDHPVSQNMKSVTRFRFSQMIAFMHTRICICIYVYMYKYTPYKYMCVYICVCVCACVRVCVFKNKSYQCLENINYDLSYCCYVNIKKPTICMAAKSFNGVFQFSIYRLCRLFFRHIWYIECVMDDSNISDIFTRFNNI